MSAGGTATSSEEMVSWVRIPSLPEMTISYIP